MSYVSFWCGDAEVLRYPAVLVLSSASFSDVPVRMPFDLPRCANCE